MSTFDQPTIFSSDDYDDDPEFWDLIIVGSGVAGSTLAAVQGRVKSKFPPNFKSQDLAVQLKRRVLVVERDLSQPNRIVGELLQPGGYLKLEELGLAEAVEGIDAQKVYGYGLFKDGRRTQIKYPSLENRAEVTGRSFHHGRFIQRLRHLAAEEELVTMRQGTVKELINQEGLPFSTGEAVCGIKYRSGTSDRIAKGHLTIVCDGMYSTLRKTFVSPSIKTPSHFVGVILDDCKLPFPNYGHVVLAKPSPVLFYPIASNQARCLVDVPGDKLPGKANGQLKDYLLTIVAPEIPEDLRGSFEEAVKNQELRCVQNKQMFAQPVQHPGALIIGDAYNMRHPLTGGGMTVALSDCKVLCDMLDTYGTFQDVKKIEAVMSDFHVQRKPLSCTINTLANALYKVFIYTGDDAHEEMRQACFDYLSLGGTYSQGPISLLAGINPQPMVLVQHFFQVALYGVARAFQPPTLDKIWRSIRLLNDAVCIIFPILKDEGWNMFWPRS